MATRAYTIETLTLQDDTDVQVKPLAIAPLRRFMEAWMKTAELKDGEDAFGVFVNCCGIALERNFKGDSRFEESNRDNALRASATEAKKGEFLSPKYKEYLEEVLDMPTIYVIMDVAGEVKLNDPKLMEKVQKALAEQNAA
jgi:hypothetical protein